ncbi:acyl-coenzyme A synthetase ACSM1, mitochondrial-like [Halichoerus grypus]
MIPLSAVRLYTWLPLPLSLHSGSVLQVVKAFIVLTPEFLSHDRDQLTKELQQHVKSVTAPYKYPRKVEFVSELPKTVTGKIKRSDLRKKEFGQMESAKASETTVSSSPNPWLPQFPHYGEGEEGSAGH